MIIVTGATGQLGQLIVQSLIRRVPVSQVGVSVRDRAKAADLATKGVRVRRADFAHPESLAQAFEGASQILMISSNARAYGGDNLAQHRFAIEAARTAGARRIVYTSHIAASSASEFAAARDHAATEDMLRTSSVAWTALRNGFYASSGLQLMGDFQKSGVIEAPADGKVSWTAHVDLAEAAAAILAKAGRYDGPTPPLTASEALDLADFAAIASELLGRTIIRRVLSDDEMLTMLAARGVPPHVSEITLAIYRASRKGEFAAVNPTLENLIGRRPKRIKELLREKIGSSPTRPMD
jgi:NAD(P)H dehydrogenase (quinone)